MKCVSCDVNPVEWNKDRQEFDTLCSHCIAKAHHAERMDQYDLAGYWYDTHWAELGGTPLEKARFAL
jgi:hypothetical protein